MQNRTAHSFAVAFHVTFSSTVLHQEICNLKLFQYDCRLLLFWSNLCYHLHLYLTYTLFGKYLVRICLQKANQLLQPFHGLGSFAFFSNTLPLCTKTISSAKSMVFITLALGESFIKRKRRSPSEIPLFQFVHVTLISVRSWTWFLFVVTLYMCWWLCQLFVNL